MIDMKTLSTAIVVAACAVVWVSLAKLVDHSFPVELQWWWYALAAVAGASKGYSVCRINELCDNVQMLLLLDEEDEEAEKPLTLDNEIADWYHANAGSRPKLPADIAVFGQAVGVVKTEDGIAWYRSPPPFTGQENTMWTIRVFPNPWRCEPPKRVKKLAGELIVEETI